MIDMMDVTFVIPMRADSAERARMLDVVVGYIQRNFRTNILIGEDDKEPRLKGRYPGCGYVYLPSHSDMFHKTRTMNRLFLEARTPIVFLHDGDNLATVKGYVQAVDVMRKTNVRAVWPYDRTRVDVPMSRIAEMESRNDLEGFDESGCRKEEIRSYYGGIVGYWRDSLIWFGMGNENIVCWGWEDVEMLLRLGKFGMVTHQLRDLPIYHFDHQRPMNSSQDNPHFKANGWEYEKVRDMGIKGLAWYVSQWEWMANAHGSELPVFDREPWSLRVPAWAYNIRGFADNSLPKAWWAGTWCIILSSGGLDECSIFSVPARMCFAPFSPPDIMDAKIHIYCHGRESFEVYVSDAGGAMSRRIGIDPANEGLNVVDVPMSMLFASPPKGGIGSIFLCFPKLNGDFFIEEISLRWG
jgi:hypothetical protein